MTTGSQSSQSLINFRTKREERILNQLWKMNSKREIAAWRKTLSPRDLKISITMSEMILLSGWDEVVMVADDCSVAMDFLNGLMAKG